MKKGKKKYLTQRADIITLASELGREPTHKQIMKHREQIWKVKTLKPAQYQKIEAEDPKLAEALYLLQKFKQIPEFNSEMDGKRIASEADYRELYTFKYKEPKTKQAAERKKEVSPYQAVKMVERDLKEAKKRARTDLQVLLENEERIKTAIDKGLPVDERGIENFRKWLDEEGGATGLRQTITKGSTDELAGIINKLSHYRSLKTTTLTGATVSYANWQVRTKGFLSGKSTKYRKAFWEVLDAARDINTIRYDPSDFWEEITTILDDANALEEVDKLIKQKEEETITEKMYKETLRNITEKYLRRVRR